MQNKFQGTVLYSVATRLRARLHILKLLYNEDAYLKWSSIKPLRLIVTYPTDDFPPPYESKERRLDLLDETTIATLLINSAETLLEISREVSESAGIQSKDMAHYANSLREVADGLRELQKLSGMKK
jgi:hypothetical protein